MRFHLTLLILENPVTTRLRNQNSGFLYFGNRDLTTAKLRHLHVIFPPDQAIIAYI